jgi:hypothetical protein
MKMTVPDTTDTPSKRATSLSTSMGLKRSASLIGVMSYRAAWPTWIEMINGLAMAIADSLKLEIALKGQS